MKPDREKWNERYKSKEFVPGEKANPFLRRQIGLLQKGRALDIATGEGRNAVFLALRGFDVEAVDISAVGLDKTRRLAGAMGVNVRTILADLDTYQIERERYDLIANFYYLNRRLIPKIKKGLKKGGQVIFETY
ncbi:MAG TPA: methyltransferase domain-containing protein, partial [bacterium]|nr:methyltransferase domain-containing protein [bacterium]